MHNDSLKYWLTLNKLPNIGPATLKKLYDHFRSPELIWKADLTRFRSIDGFGKLQYESLRDNRPTIDPDDELARFHLKNMSVLALDDPLYPDLLKNIYDPPSLIYYKGRIDFLSKRSIAIVGTRKPSSYGSTVAEKFAKELSALGFVIVSGFAYGIDTAAHKAAISSQGLTVAVFGCGLDVIYPAENIRLAEEISANGCLISEFPPGTPTSPWTFPQRNRIISGLTMGTIVIEGAEDSGSLITAKSALEQGREVFAVPGPIDNGNSKGPHWLIKQGAKLAASVEDVLDELNIPYSKELLNVGRKEIDVSSLGDAERCVIALLSNGPLHIDEVTERSGLVTQEVSSALMMLEIKGYVKQMAGKVFSLYA